MAGAADLGGTVEYLKTLSREFVITRGSKGALVWDGQALIEIDPVAVDAIDTVGAGGHVRRSVSLWPGLGVWKHQRAGALASAAAARLVTRLGPRMAAAETQTILQGFR